MDEKAELLVACQEQHRDAGWLQRARTILKWEMGDSKDKRTFSILSHSWNITASLYLGVLHLRSFSMPITPYFPSLSAHSFLGSAWRCYLSVSGLMLKRFQVNFQRGSKISGDSILAQKTGNHDGWQWKAPFHTQIKYLSRNK